MALEGFSQEQLDLSEQEMLAKIPDGGRPIGNTNLRSQLNWDESMYWAIRDRLLDRGVVELGKGKGGSVKRTLVSPVPPTDVASSEGVSAVEEATITARISEDALYEPIAAVLRGQWVKDKRYDQSIVEITARQGARVTGGRWTRPDVVMASLTTYPYVPGKKFDVTTFEVKRHDAADVTVVYEALSHLRCASRAYVVIDLPEEYAESEEDVLEVIQGEAKRHGVGVIVAGDPMKYETWEERVEAVRSEPEPEKLNDFLAKQVSTAFKEMIARWFR